MKFDPFFNPYFPIFSPFIYWGCFHFLAVSSVWLLWVVLLWTHMHLYLSACLFSFLLDVYLVMETLLSFCPKIYMNLNSAGKCLSIAQWREILLMTGFEVLIFWFEILLSNRWPPSPNKTEKQRCAWWGRWGGQKLYEISLHTTPPTSLGLEEAPPDSSALGSSHQNHWLPQTPLLWEAAIRTTAPKGLSPRPSSPHR